jgi:hypothetical protein
MKSRWCATVSLQFTSSRKDRPTFVHYDVAFDLARWLPNDQ